MNQSLQERIALVTGASGGIGAAVAKSLAAAGATVIVHYSSNKVKADKVVSEITTNGGIASSAQADLSNSEAVTALFKEVSSRYGKLDILVNNAGIYATTPLGTITSDIFNKLFGVNVLGLLLTTQAAVPLFSEQGGSIINIGALSGRMASPNQSTYAGTKGAVDAITLSLSKELGYKKIRVNTLNPGAVETDGLSDSGFMTQAMRGRILASTPLGRTAQPDDIADIVVFLASNSSRWVNGQIINAAGGLTY